MDKAYINVLKLILLTLFEVLKTVNDWGYRNKASKITA